MQHLHRPNEHCATTKVTGAWRDWPGQLDNAKATEVQLIPFTIFHSGTSAKATSFRAFFKDKLVYIVLTIPEQISV